MGAGEGRRKRGAERKQRQEEEGRKWRQREGEYAKRTDRKTQVRTGTERKSWLFWPFIHHGLNEPTTDQLQANEDWTQSSKYSNMDKVRLQTSYNVHIQIEDNPVFTAELMCFLTRFQNL